MEIGDISSAASPQIGVAIEKKALDNQEQLVQKLLQPALETTPKPNPDGKMSVYA